MQFLLALLEHPGILISLLVFILVFIGMTYEFILRLFGKGTSNISSPKVDGDDDSEEEPPEPANVPKPPTGPKDTLKGEAEIEGAEEIEDEDGNVSTELFYNDSNGPLPDPPSYWWWECDQNNQDGDPERETYAFEKEGAH